MIVQCTDNPTHRETHDIIEIATNRLDANNPDPFLDAE
jgi:hypothetical protein